MDISKNQWRSTGGLTLENNRPKIMGALKKSQFLLGQRVY